MALLNGTGNGGNDNRWDLQRLKILFVGSFALLTGLGVVGLIAAAVLKDKPISGEVIAILGTLSTLAAGSLSKLDTGTPQQQLPPPAVDTSNVSPPPSS